MEQTERDALRNTNDEPIALQLADACDTLTKLMMLVPGLDTMVCAAELRRLQSELDTVLKDRAGLALRVEELEAEAEAANDLHHSCIDDLHQLRAKLAALQSDDELPPLPDMNPVWDKLNDWAEAEEGIGSMDEADALESHTLFPMMQAYARDAQAMLRAKLGRFREHVENFAAKGGWAKESGEGAFEFVQRISYEQGAIDAGAKLARQKTVCRVKRVEDGGYAEVVFSPFAYTLKAGDKLYLAAGAAPQPAQGVNAELTDEQIMDVAKPFIRSVGGYSQHEDAIPDNGAIEDFSRALIASAQAAQQKGGE